MTRRILPALLSLTACAAVSLPASAVPPSVVRGSAVVRGSLTPHLSLAAAFTQAESVPPAATEAAVEKPAAKSGDEPDPKPSAPAAGPAGDRPASAAQPKPGQPPAAVPDSQAGAKPAASPLAPRPVGPAPGLPGQRLSSAREMLELCGVDQSQVDHLINGQPLGPEEQETVCKILYNFPRFGRDKVQAWCQKDVAWADVARDPQPHRLQVFLVKGRATQIERVALPAEAAERFEFADYFLLRFTLPEASHPVVVCTRTVPAAWASRATLDERAGFFGLFLKTGAANGGSPELVFAAERVAWFPDRLDAAENIRASQVWLGDLGMDFGLFDDVRKTNRQSFGATDRECFYQLLVAAGRADPAESWRRTEGPVDLRSLLSAPETHHGQLVTIDGVARRVQKILVDEEDIRQRFGIQHYYQVDVFLPLGELEVRLGQQSGQEKVPVFANNFPVTVCLLRLPAGLPVQDNMHEHVRLTGFFFKTWAYRSEYIASFDSRQRQPAPAFMGTTGIVIPITTGRQPYLSWLVGSLFCVVFLGLAWGIWFLRRSDRQFSAALRKRSELPAGQSLKELNLPTRAKPDGSARPPDQSEPPPPS